MNNDEYYLGGSLPIHATTYVKRQADDDLYQDLKNGNFCYVLNSRQMGKSSLRIKTIQRLKKENFDCVSIDMTEIGTHDITPSQWYASIIDTILTGLNLDDEFDIEELWEANSKLSNVKLFSKFIGEKLLRATSQSIVIFIDEIDSTLSLPFSIDDFFAFVRDCYNKRAENYDYQRLTFAMIGVATPACLIKDKKRTPFNIGRSIELTGFRLAEVEPLAKGLVDKTANINKLMEVVLDWTGGQPFLTQKVCKLISNSPEIVPDGQEAEWVAELVGKRIIDNWQVHDDPEHLKTIRDHLLVNEKRTSRLLCLYQQVLTPLPSPLERGRPEAEEKKPPLIKGRLGGIVADDSPDQMELRLTGLVIKHEGRLQVANRIYQEVFNLQWVEKELGKLRPYSETFTAWEESGCKDESRLLRGQALADALAWAVDKSLSDRDYQFLAAAQEVEKQAIKLEKQAVELEKLEAQVKLEAQLKANQILEEAKQKADLKLAEAEAVGKSIISKLLSNSGKYFEGLLQALRAAKELPPPNQIFQPQADSKIQITDALTQAIYIIGDGKYRELNRLESHENWVYGVAFSPDGEIIASASADKTVKLWNPQGQLLQTLTGHENWVHGVAFSSDGQMIASASADKTVKLWNPQGQLLQTLTGHENSVNSIAFSSDGQMIGSPSRDNTVKLWNPQGQLLQTLMGHKHWVYGVAFSPDGEIIASASADKTVKLWNPQGQLLQTLNGHKDWVYGVTFSPDGQIIASASRDKTVKLWNPQGKLLQTLIGHENSVYGVAFSSDGQMIASASRDNTVKLWNRQRKLLQTLTGHDNWVRSVAFSPDGQMIASASRDNTVKLWNRQRKLLQTLTGHEDWVRSVAFSPDGEIITSASRDKTVKLWNPQGQLLQTLIGHEDWVHSVAFSPDGEIIASASRDKTVKLWNPQGQLLQTLSGHEDWVNSAVFSPDRGTIASASADQTVKLWNPQGHLLQTLTGHKNSVNSVAFSPDGKIIASASADQTVKLWNVWKFDRLHQWGCNWMRDYLENNPNISESDKHLCDGVGE